MKDKFVIISVLGGVAEIAYISQGVNVTIVDLDNEPDQDLDAIVKEAKEAE